MFIYNSTAISTRNVISVKVICASKNNYQICVYYSTAKFPEHLVGFRTEEEAIKVVKEFCEKVDERV